MKLINIPKEEFNQKTAHLPCSNWHQTSNWATLKAHTGWGAHFIGYINDNDEIVAACVLLAKNIPLSKKQLFYSPRGFLIDFNNDDLLRSFHKDLINYVKEHNGFELLIDPYLEYQHRDQDANIIDDGFNNQSVIDTLIDLGYHHNNGFNLYSENLQPRWIYTVTLKDKTYKEVLKGYKPENRRHVKKKDLYAINVRELNRDEIHLYKDIMAHTASRRGFIDRPLKYYVDMYDAMHDDQILRYYIAEIDFEKCIQNMSDELDKSSVKLNKLKDTFKTLDEESNQYEKVSKEIKEEENRNQSLIKKLDTVKTYAKNVNSNNAVLSGITLMKYGNEEVMLLAGNYEDYELFASSNILCNELIKLSINEKQDRFNFYGITGDFSESNPMIGLYNFKKRFGGQVVELIGEFEYVISKPTKLFYEFGLKCYNLTKKFKH